jgi:hypothetical protein
MAFDFEDTFKGMFNAAKGVVEGDFPELKSKLEEVLNNEKEALKDIAEARIRGEINDEDLLSQIEDEKLTLESGILMLEVHAKVTLQNAINAAMNVLKSAIDTVIKGL